MFVTELRSCVKVEVAILGSPSLISLMVYVDIKQHSNNNKMFVTFRLKERVCN